MKINIFLNVKPLEIVHTPNKETISQEILLKLGKKSDRHWYLNLDSCPCCPLPAQQHGNSTPHQQSQEHRPPSLSSYQSEDYLPGREERQHFSSDSQPPVAEAKFWGSITERWGNPFFCPAPVVAQRLYCEHGTAENTTGIPSALAPAHEVRGALSTVVEAT